MMRILCAVLLCYFITAIAHAEGTISGVSGTVSGGQSITISGAGFGVGPSVLLYDEFSGTDGNEVSLSGPAVGAWTAYADGTYHPLYITDGSQTSALMLDGTKNRNLKVTFSSTTEVYLSYKVKIPTGYYFPDASALGQFNTSLSCWKMAWLMDTPATAAGDDDVCIPTRPDTTHWAIAGNDGGIQPTFNMETGWFSFLGWNRVSAWLKAGSSPTVDTGTIWTQGMSAEHGQKIAVTNASVLMDGDDSSYDDATPEWTQINISGWHNAGVAGENVRAIYDDVYIATGANAAARVEIGDASVYTSCTKLAIATPTSWNATSISATVRSGEFSSGEYVYLFVIDANNTPSVGYGPLQIGGSGGATGRYYRARLSE